MSENYTMSGETYWELVERIATKRNGDEVFNGSTAHASVLIERMFAHANESVCLFSRGLDSGVYNRKSVISEARKFLQESSRALRVIVEVPEIDHYLDHNFFDLINEFPNAKIKVATAESIEGLTMNFALMDADCFRIEPDKASHEAIAVFGDEKTGKRYLSFFDGLWQSAVSLIENDKSLTTA